MLIEFRVDRFPPRNHRAMSMWGLDDQAPRVIALREQALKARAQAGMGGPIQGPACLKVEIYVPKSKLWLRGDLDSLLAGVCDALHAAPPNAKPNALFVSPEHANVAPKLAILIKNDSQLVEVSARGHELAEGQEPYYVVAVEWDMGALSQSDAAQ